MNIASILVLVFLAITFIQSGYDKVTDWKGNVEYLTSHFFHAVTEIIVFCQIIHVTFISATSKPQYHTFTPFRKMYVPLELREEITST